MSIQSRFQLVPGSRQEMLAALYPFILAGIILPLIGILSRSGILPVPNPVVAVLMVGLVGLLGLLLVSGLALGLPRWSLPYLGLLLAVLNVYLFVGVLEEPVNRLSSALFRRTSLLADVFMDGAFWFGLLLVMLLLVLGSRVFPRFHRFRNDWTLLSFIVYGAVPFITRLSFDPYQGQEPYELLIFLVLAWGLWFYLRTDDLQKRFWTLFGALMASIFMIVASKVILIPLQDWPVQRGPELVQSEVKYTLIMWGWPVLIMLLPLLLRGLSQAGVSPEGDD